MNIHILTIFPKIFTGFLESSLIQKAIERSLVTITLRDIREFAKGPHYKTDDTPYGGGAGMVMTPEPLALAIEASKAALPGAPVILLSPAGRPFCQATATELSHEKGLILVCGRYEGIDQRVIDLLIDREISIGDYVLMGGEVAAMAVTEAVARLVPGVLGNETSVQHESFAGTVQMLEAPQYTKPQEFRGLQVPAELLTGNHAVIEKWRNEQSLKLTQSRRPDLLKK